MKTAKLYSIGVAALTVLAFSQPSSAQMANFYTSPNYNLFINNMISNSIWNSSMQRYTGLKTGSSGRSSASRSTSSSEASPAQVPDYRKYPAVQFKSTGTRLTLQEYLDNLKVTPEQKAEVKNLVLDVFKEYEAAAAAKGYPNDWALAYVSYIGLNSLVYHGKTAVIPYEQNVGLRDLVAEYATDNGIFNNVSDRQKQELYELLVMTGGLTYTLYENALKKNNVEDLKNLKQSAADNLRIVGLKP